MAFEWLDLYLVTVHALTAQVAKVNSLCFLIFACGRDVPEIKIRGAYVMWFI